MKDSIARKTYYELLGICQDASTIEIQCAFSDLARIYDPESRFFADIINEPISTEQVEVFNLIKQAYETLLDDEQRARYDQSLVETSASSSFVR